jgi:hypothetical protein
VGDKSESGSRQRQEADWHTAMSAAECVVSQSRHCLVYASDACCKGAAAIRP